MLNTSEELAHLAFTGKAGNLLGSILVQTKIHKIPGKIVYVRNRNNYNEYITILSTDCSLSDREIVYIYGARWNIELFFCTSKSLLNLVKDSQGISYNSLVGSTTTSRTYS